MPLRSRLVCVLTLALALGVGSSASAMPGMEVAVQDDPALFAGLYSNPRIALKLSDKLKATRIRVNVVWSYVVGKAAKKKKAAKHIRYNWTGYDNLNALA